MSNIFPFTVLVAIVLFVTKEVLETIKKWKEKKRKIRAMKLLLAEELELNHWVWKEMQLLVARVQDELKLPKGSKFQIKKSKAATERFECIRPNGSVWGQGFPPVHEEQYHKLAVEVASADEQFYALLSKCYKAVAELKHFRNGVYSYIDDDGDENKFREGFTTYVKDGLPDIYNAMNALYEFCTERKLETHRLR